MYKEIVNVPKASLFLVKRIRQRLEAKKWDKSSNSDEIVVVVTKEFPYSYDAIKPIERLFSRDGWKFRMTNYSRGETVFSYTFRMEKERKYV